jgi:hypothetical protein
MCLDYNKKEKQILYPLQIKPPTDKRALTVLQICTVVCSTDVFTNKVIIIQIQIVKY